MSSDLRVGAVNDIVDLAHYSDARSAEFWVCGEVDAQLRRVLGHEQVRVLDAKSTMISKREFPQYVWDVLKWRRLLRKLAPDVVHLNYLGHSPSLACAAYLMGIPVVSRAGGIPPWPLRSWISRYIANCAAHASTLVSTDLRDRVRVTGDLVRLDRLDNLVRQSPIPERSAGDIRFLFIGQLVERKGVHLLVEAMAHVPLADLLLVGGDWSNPGYARSCRNSIERLQLESRVFCLNHRTDVAALVNDCDVLVVPSLEDARPRVVLEAMFLGRPVIAAAVGGIPELVRDGVTGLLVPPGDHAKLAAAMQMMVADPGVITRMGAAAQAAAATDFDPGRTARRYIDVYSELVAKDRR